MGGGKKPTAPTAPGFQGATTMYGNQVTGKSYMDPSLGFVNQYLPTQDEQNQHSLYNNALSSLIPSLGQSSEQEQNQINSSKNAYLPNATADFNRMLEPEQRAQREDYASRFGTLNQTPYLDAQNEMQKQQVLPGYQNIANQSEQYANQLYQQQQQQKIAQLGALLGGQGQNQGMYQQGLANPLAAGQQLNQFNQQTYGTQGGIYGNQLSNYTSGGNAFLGALGTIGGAAMNHFLPGSGTALNLTLNQ